MKTKLMLGALALAAAVSVGCSDIDIYEIDAPEDLQSKIDAYAAQQAAKSSGDTTVITITTPVAGAEDNSSGWWTDWSRWTGPIA